MRTQRAYRALDNAPAPESVEAGMHNAYDIDGNAHYCPCAEFWAGDFIPGYHVAHEEYSPEARLTFKQIAYLRP